MMVVLAATSSGFTCINLFNHPRTWEVSTSTILIMQMEKLKLGEVGKEKKGRKIKKRKRKERKRKETYL